MGDDDLQYRDLFDSVIASALDCAIRIAAAGRGFVHVSPSGNLEPCPAAPFPDTDLTRVPLKDALKSGLLARIRAQHGVLTEKNGGCALRAVRDGVRELAIPRVSAGGNDSGQQHAGLPAGAKRCYDPAAN